MCGVNGFGVLWDTNLLILITILHSWLTILFYQLYLKRLQAAEPIKWLACLGFLTLNVILSALWFTQYGDGLIIDLELFCYEP